MTEARATIVVAGGSGLVGRHLVRALHEAGYHVVVLSRSPGRAEVDLPLGASAVAWDGRTPGDWTGALAGAAGVVNLAGASIGRRWTQTHRREILDSRVASTTALVEAIGRLGPAERPPVLVNSSGIDYAGDRPGDEPVGEDAKAGDTFLAGVCVAWEAAAARAEAHGVRVAALRTSFVLARGSEPLRRLALPFRLFAGGPLGSGRQWFPWVHMEDAVGLCLLALTDERLTGPVNVVAPDVRHQAETAQEIGRVLHRPSRLPTPAPVLRLALGGMADLLLHGQRAEPRRALEAGYAFRFPELPAALEDVLGR